MEHVSLLDDICALFSLLAQSDVAVWATSVSMFVYVCVYLWASGCRRVVKQWEITHADDAFKLLLFLCCPS